MSLLVETGISDLAEAAAGTKAFDRAQLARVLAAGNPLAAARLADLRRRALAGDRALHPWTLRVRGRENEDSTEASVLVSHAMGDLAGIPATEMELVGAPDDLDLDRACALVRRVHDSRPDLPLRAFTATRVAAWGGAPALSRLRDCGLATLSWVAGTDDEEVAADVLRAAAACGMAVCVPIPYRQGGLDDRFLDRVQSVRGLAAGGSVRSVVPLPDRTELASPLDGTAGTEDVLAFALARLGLGGEVPHVTVDAHVLGHKLGAVLLSAGASDMVAAQAARSWPRPDDDGPRPLNPARVASALRESRRTPVLRDGLFLECEVPA